MGAEGTPVRQLSDFGYDPCWSPDGSEIAFTSNRDGNFELYVMPSVGGEAARLTNTPDDEFEHSWSPDGQTLAYALNQGHNDILTIDVTAALNPSPR